MKAIYQQLTFSCRVCVQVWRARSSQALHAYITFLSRSDAQWAATQLHGWKGTHTWTVRPMRTSELDRCARPPTESERVVPRQDLSANLTLGATLATNRMFFSPTAIIIPFYAPLLPLHSASISPTNEPSSDSTTSQDRLFPHRHFNRQSSAPETSTIIATKPKLARAKSWGIIPLPEISDSEQQRGSVAPQLYIAPATPPSSVEKKHSLGPDQSLSFSRAHSQPAVPLLYHLQDSRNEIDDVSTGLMRRPKTTRRSSQPIQVETTLFAHGPIVEPDSSSFDSPSVAPKQNDDRENRFDPFGDAGDIDVGKLRSSMMRLSVGGSEKTSSFRGHASTKRDGSLPRPTLRDTGNTLSLEGRIKRKW